MLKTDIHPLARGRGWQSFPGFEIVPDLTEDPRITDRGAADHDAVDTKPGLVFRGFLRTVNIAIAKDRDIDPGVVLHPRDKGPIGLTLVQLASGAAVDRQSLDTGVL